MNAFGEVSEYKLQNGENNKSYSYTYDSDGNITSISLNGSLQQSFTYNSSNELVRVDDKVTNKSVAYAYDFVGNITSVKTYLYTTGALGSPLTTQSYTYNSQNQRTDLGYDASGNLTSLNGYTFTWSGRRLTAAVNANTNISYTYNHNGIRTSKTINGTVINYTVDENNNITEQTDGTNTIKFVYDSSGSPVYFTYNNATYYYEKNLQGDIIAILDSSGNTVVEYTYDIWGKLVSITGTLADTVGTINPLRYRGYYYDTETQLYYLQSRYYSPDLMRFISQDDAVLSNDQGQPIGSNLYVYCLNNPINLTDPSGKRAINITSKLTNLMRSNALKFAAYIMGQIIFRGVVRGMVNAFKYFYNNSKNGGSWDLKRLPSWKLSKGDWFVFRGKRLRNDDPGNIHFGYVGSVMFPVHILRAGAGVYQIYSGTSRWKYWWSFFDDPRDSAMISYGNTLFKADILKSIIRILKAGNRFRIYWI